MPFCKINVSKEVGGRLFEVGVLSQAYGNNATKRLAQCAGLNPTTFSTHSFCTIGAATTAATAATAETADVPGLLF